jgi:hypothetical protein
MSDSKVSARNSKAPISRSFAAVKETVPVAVAPVIVGEVNVLFVRVKARNVKIAKHVDLKVGSNGVDAAWLIQTSWKPLALILKNIRDLLLAWDLKEH